MNFGVFFQTFYLVFSVLMSVGPGFLTIANIAMTTGVKTSAIAVTGCFIGDCILITAGAFYAKEVAEAIPKAASMVLLFIAILLLLYLAIKFWKTKIANLSAKQFGKKKGLSFSITLFSLKMSSPISIIGYGTIFTQVVKVSDDVFSACLGGCCASFVVNAIMVTVFGTIGKKINTKILYILNKISAIFIGCFALFLFTNFLKDYF